MVSGDHGSSNPLVHCFNDEALFVVEVWSFGLYGFFSITVSVPMRSRN